MKRRNFAVLLYAATLQADPWGMPIHSTNTYINQIIFYRPYAQSATMAGTPHTILTLSQSNIFQQSDSLTADFELTSLEFTQYFPAGKTFQFAFNLPLYYVSSGFMDGPLDTVHHALGITTTRENEGHVNDRSMYRIGNDIMREGDYCAIGNPQMELKAALYDSGTAAFALTAGVKMPFGKTSNGFTTEKTDYMLGLLSDYTDASVRWTVNAYLTANGKRSVTDEIVSMPWRYFLFVGNEISLGNVFSKEPSGPFHLLLGYTYMSAPYSGPDKKFSSYSHLLQAALRAFFNAENYLDIFINQNTIPRHNEADITLGLSYHF